MKDEDFIDQLFVASSHDTVLCFSSRGRVYWLKVYELPQAGRNALGRPMVNLLPLEQGERINAVLPVRDYPEDRYVFMAAASGTVKKTPLADFSRPRTAGIIAVDLCEDDRLVDVALTDGLQLAALSIQDAPDPDDMIAVFTGDDRYVVDYLLAEVFEHQSPSTREFLLRTAILDRFCGSLCEAVTEIDQPDGESNSAPSSGQAIIDRIDRANLFVIRLDNKREWYRYHHLFADFLRLRLMKRPAAEVAELHRRAAAWYARHDLAQEAILHYLAARDLAQAADLIERVGVQLIVQGQLRQVLDWLAGLPDDFIGTRFDWVQTLESERIARRLSEQRPEGLAPLNVLVQVNVSGEASKSGVAPEAVLALARAVAGLPRLRLRGLMAIPEPSADVALQRARFRALRELLERLRGEGLALDTLSMGMSDDLEAAIAEGASLVRIGTAIFGAREKVRSAA